jgi:hypothetical protein
MTKYHEYLHQKSRVVDYRDRITGGLFQLHRILTTYFPDSDIATLIKIQNIVDGELKKVIDSIQDNDGV